MDFIRRKERTLRLTSRVFPLMALLLSTCTAWDDDQTVAVAEPALEDSLPPNGGESISSDVSEAHNEEGSISHSVDDEVVQHTAEEVAFPIEQRSVRYVWRFERDLLNGWPSGIAVTDEGQIWVTGATFDRNLHADIYEAYVSDPSRSVFSHAAESPSGGFSPFYSPTNAFVIAISRQGQLLFEETFHSTAWDYADPPFRVDSDVYFTVRTWLRGPGGGPPDSQLRVAKIVPDDVIWEEYLLGPINANRSPYRVDRRWISSKLGSSESADVYDVPIGPTDPGAVSIDWPADQAMMSRFDVTFSTDDHIGALSIREEYRMIESTGEGTLVQVDFDSVDVVPNRYVGIAGIPRPRHLVGNLEGWDGFFWSSDLDDAAQSRHYRYTRVDRSAIRGILADDGGALLFGSVADRAILVRLSNDGGLSWWADLGQGALRDVVWQDGRYFALGRRTEIRTDDPGDRGTNVMYLFEFELLDE